MKLVSYRHQHLPKGWWRIIPYISFTKDKFYGHIEYDLVICWSVFEGWWTFRKA